MKFISLIFFILLWICMSSMSFSQTLVFGELTGNPVNTTGWNLTGSALVNNNEIILTPNDYNQSGTIYYDKAVDLGLCPKFTVDFEFRLFDGGAADGLAFCFLDQAPTGWVVGNVLGIPPTSAGLKIAFDTWDNGCNVRTPTIQILNSPNGYDECDPAMVRLNNSGSGSGVLGFIHSNNYIQSRIIYDNGVVEVWLKNPPSFFNPNPAFTLFLTTTITPINYAGYFGFSASTGLVTDKQSIRNVKIYSNAVLSDAGSDLTTCSGQANVIGTSPAATNTYLWTPASGLNQTNIANPTANISNTTGSSIITEYIVTTYATSTGPGCVTKDTIQITTNPIFNTSQSETICNGQSFTLGGQTFTNPGTHLVTLQSQFNCDSVVTLNLSFSPAPTSSQSETICFGDSYTFNGTNYTTSGTYNALFPMSGGCDSVAILNLTVIPELISTLPITICQGDTYTFGGITYSTAGNYAHTFAGSHGCDSIVTLQLDVVSSFTSTINPVICQGDNYVFDGQSYTSSGTHVATFQTVSGCDSVVTMNLTVNPSYAPVINQSICQGLSYTFNGQTYSSTGTYTQNLQSVSGCDSIITLNLTVSPSISNTLNTTICQGETYSFNNQSLTTSGTYSGTFPSVGGCDSIVTLNLLVSPSFNSTVNKTICQGDTYLLNAISYTVAGTYTANLQSIAGCDSIVTLNLTVNPVPTMPQVISNSPLGCPGEEYVVQVVNPQATGVYWWYGPNNYSAQGETVAFVTTGTSEGVYSVVLKENGCVSDTTMTSLLIDGAELSDFDFPNVITPNGDMVNDQLDIDLFFNACVPYELTLWNRWGNIIYTQKYGEAPFKGYDQSGLKVTPGVYFYKLSYEGLERQGSVSVMY